MATETYHSSAGYTDETPRARLSRCLAQAQAMAVQTYGDCTLMRSDEETIDAFMWALHDKIAEARMAMRALLDEQSTKEPAQ